MFTSPEIQAARAFFVLKHGDQMYGNEPYYVHFDAVAAKLVEHGYDTPAWIIIGLGHDCYEDTDTTLVELTHMFGQEVALGIDTCSGFGLTRKLRNAMIYGKLRLNPQYAPAKCADRILNLRMASINKSFRHAEMYLGEAQDFDPLIEGNVIHTMWLDLQDAYAECEALLASRRAAQ